jgi:signal transduction histidine kinase
LAAYRIVQESLTNAHKHGRGAGVTVMIGHGPGRLRIEVRTAAPVIDAPANGVQGSGHGIVGMRERATTVGGTLRAEPVAGGGFGVVATLPLPPDATPEDA